MDEKVLARREKDKKRYRENPEKKKTMSAKWKKENPQKVKETCAKYYQKNKEKILSDCAEYYRANSDKVKARIYSARRKNGRTRSLEMLKARRLMMTIEEKELLKRRIHLKKQLIELTQKGIKKLEEVLEDQERMNNDRPEERSDSASVRSAKQVRGSLPPG